MANCNCNKCNPTRGCGCADSPDRTPCSYSDCSVGSERCSDVQCAECVSYCGTSFQVGSSTNMIKIDTGERLDSIIQKLSLMITSSAGACASDDIHHAPYNVYASNITNNSAMIIWNGESTATVQIEVFSFIGGVPTSQGIVGPTVLQLAITGLTAATNYSVILVSTDSIAGTCESVEILFTTLL